MQRGFVFRLAPVLFAAALALSVIPAAAAPIAQFGDFVTFEKPEWGLKMLYRKDYHVQNEADVVIFSQRTESMVFPSLQYIIVSRDPAFADPGKKSLTTPWPSSSRRQTILLKPHTSNRSAKRPSPTETADSGPSKARSSVPATAWRATCTCSRKTTSVSRSRRPAP